MSLLFSEFLLKNHRIRNRIVFPPVVCHEFTHEDGFVTDLNVDHYDQRSDDGPGIVITEATCVVDYAKAARRQLGIWSDDHIPGLSRISRAVKNNGAVSLIQLHHAGIITPAEVTNTPAGPSADPNIPNSRELLHDEIPAIRKAFIDGAIRAKKAGFDGIELHGAHGYLLNQFASSAVNRRSDEYGSDFLGRMRLATEIIAGIRKALGNDFIIGYRIGAVSPTLDDGIAIAKYLENTGIDLLHVSHGGTLKNLPRPPKDFEYNWIVYSGTEVKKSVSLPVIVVNEIKTRDRAEWLIGNGMADFVSLARPILADPLWVRHVRDNQKVNLCSSCKPRCKWYEEIESCPARNRLKEAGTSV